ncbi:uncharacterized protein ColSpa_09704 [Colletotrichum spaethianum]|uniref:Uncharacterized protein n=1 Tax=Colletotrichum spaethianum TaxID=700344 RepID=A0AA37PC25_9PEZI|nr:uncharacterized protein ColSpa_09704 [Colletotrichum spaethianum]GKT49523.1 hypothetical protein ColSpa_09704 [Colletotrichum spaethianum]
MAPKNKDSVVKNPSAKQKGASQKRTALASPPETRSVRRARLAAAPAADEDAPKAPSTESGGGTGVAVAKENHKSPSPNNSPEVASSSSSSIHPIQAPKENTANIQNNNYQQATNMSSFTEFTLASLIEGIRAATGASYMQAFRQLHIDLNVLARRVHNTGQVFAGNPPMGQSIVANNQIAYGTNQPGPGSGHNIVPGQGLVIAGAPAAEVPGLAVGGNAGRPMKRYLCDLCPGGSRSYTRMYSLNQHKELAHHIPMPRSDSYRARHGLLDEAEGDDNAVGDNMEDHQEQVGDATASRDGNGSVEEKSEQGEKDN